MKKVKEPQVDDLWYCHRCKQEYCQDCVDKHEVDFKVWAKHDQQEINWEELVVCPWCYNQLVDIAQSKSKEEEVNK